MGGSCPADASDQAEPAQAGAQAVGSSLSDSVGNMPTLTAPLAPAEAHFIGRVRATTAWGEPLQALELEHYPGMTELQLQTLAAACG